MKNTNPIFSLKNFRSFGEEGADFELAPITVLTGCNSAGKSSLVKALLLLSKQSKRKEIEPMGGRFNLVGGYGHDITNISWNDLNIASTDLGLGKFDKILNVTASDKEIQISYRMWSKFLQEEIIINRFYNPSGDVLNDGRMSMLTITKLDGSLIVSIPNADRAHIDYSGYVENRVTNWDIIAENYQRYNKSVSYAKAKMALNDVKMSLGWLADDMLAGTGKRKRITDKFEKDYDKLRICCNRINLDIMTYESFMTRLEVTIEGLFKEYNIAEYQEDIIREMCNEIELNESHYTIGNLGCELEQRFNEYNIKDDLEEKPKYDPNEWFSVPEELYTKTDSALYTSEIWDGELELKKKYGGEHLEFIREYLKKSDSLGSDERNIVNEKFWYLQLIVNEVSRPWFIQGIKYINSSTAVVSRLYSADGTDKFSSALNQCINNIRRYAEVCAAEAYGEYRSTGDFIDRWIKKFEIGDGIEIAGTEEGLGILVYLKKKKGKRLLADEGYGVTQLVALLLQISNSITFDAKKRPAKYICVEEPEVHLHPKYQSLLADMFVEAYHKYNIHFIIETHSEYLIRKLQVLVADKENKLTPNDVSLNYVDKDENGISTNRKIEILEDGRLSEPFGPGFFDEADSLAMDLMKFKVRR